MSTTVSGPARAPARASVLVAGFTALSRLTGLLRVLLVGAVLGPTHLGNAYQVTNTLPNLVWYGFLAGSLVPTVLVPVLVRQIESGQESSLVSVSRGFLGVVSAASLVVAPVAIVLLPVLLQLATVGVPGTLAEEQVRLSRLLVVLTLPQILLYAVVGTSNAVLYARRRFVLAAVGPSVENVGVMTVLGVVAVRHGGNAAVTSTADLILLGAGSTAAVGLNAALQWWGARRQGVTLFPAGGWRQPEVTALVRRAGRSVGTAALLATQTLVVLLLASRVTGGTVSLQIGLNFYALPVALIATPIGIAVLPELARAWHAHDLVGFRSTYLNGITAALFLAVPATVGYVLLARPLADAVASGALRDGPGETMIADALAVLAVGLVGQALFFVTTQAAFASDDTATPLWCMAGQAALCVGLSAAAVVLADGPATVPLVAGCYAVATLAGGAGILLRVAGRWPGLYPVLVSSIARTAVSATAMAAVVAVVVRGLDGSVTGQVGSIVMLVSAALAGAVSFVASAWLLRSRELAWWVSGLRRQETRPARAGAGR